MSPLGLVAPSLSVTQARFDHLLTTRVARHGWPHGHCNGPSLCGGGLFWFRAVVSGRGWALRFARVHDDLSSSL
jgi:hypothetical protein